MDIRPLNPDQTMNIFQGDALVQIQHKGDRVEFIEHLDKGPDPVDVHVVTRIDKDGSITFDW